MFPFGYVPPNANNTPQPMNTPPPSGVPANSPQIPTGLYPVANPFPTPVFNTPQNISCTVHVHDHKFKQGDKVKITTWDAYAILNIFYANPAGNFSKHVPDIQPSETGTVLTDEEGLIVNGLEDYYCEVATINDLGHYESWLLPWQWLKLITEEPVVKTKCTCDTKTVLMVTGCRCGYFQKEKEQVKLYSW